MDKYGKQRTKLEQGRAGKWGTEQGQLLARTQDRQGQTQLAGEPDKSQHTASFWPRSCSQKV